MLTLAVPKVRAWELLHTPDYAGRLSMGDLYNLMIEAGYSEETAQEVASQRGTQRLDAGQKM